MGVRILHHEDDVVTIGALYCSTSDVAFGPIFYGDDRLNGWERAELFCQWNHDKYGIDPRRYTDLELEHRYHEWAAQEEEQLIERERKYLQSLKDDDD